MKPPNLVLALLTAIMFLLQIPIHVGSSQNLDAQDDASEAHGHDPPSPMGPTIDPWFMNRYNETHSGATVAKAPSAFTTFWSNSTPGNTWSSPAIADGKVFIGSGNAMYAFDLDTGRRVWRTPTDSPVPGGYGVTSSPAYANGLVFFGADRIYALDANTGFIQWRVNHAMSQYGDGSPTVWGNFVFIGAGDRKLYAIEQMTGTVVWMFNTSWTLPENYGLFSSPAIWGGYVYLADCDGVVYKISIIQPGLYATADFSFSTNGAIYGSPVIYDGKVYIGNGYHSPIRPTNKFYALSALDLSMVWRFPTANTAISFFSSAAVYNDTIFTGSVEGMNTGNLYALDPRTGAERWRWPIGTTWSSPGIASGKLFIGNKNGDLYSFNASPFLPPNWDQFIPIGGDVSSSPSIADERLCVGTSLGGGQIFCFGKPPSPTDNPPIVEAWEPGGSPGQIYTAGTPVDVRWKATDDMPMPSNTINISYGLTTWTDIVRNTANDGIHTWDTTGVTPGTYYIRVSAYDSIGQESNDRGNFTFEIVAAPDNPPTVYAWEPGGTPGQSYNAGQLVTVRWLATDDNPMPLNNIDIRYGNGMTWTDIVLGTANDGLHTWDTTGVPVGAYYINISAVDSAGQVGSDQGNYTFQIVSPDSPPTMLTWEPGGTAGQSYTVGQFVQVRWLAVDDQPMPANNINISYGSGMTWTDVVRNTANDGSHTWDTTLVSPGTYYINISVYDSIGQQTWDLGNFTFQIGSVNDPPTATILQPSGGESYSGGTTINIVWTMSDLTTPTTDLVVYLNYTSSAGSGQIAGPLIGNLTHNWTTPLIDASDVVVTIDVIDTEGSKGTDSSVQFEIDSTRPTIISTQPYNGETGVTRNSNVQATWIEGMNQSATEASFTLYDNATWTPVIGVKSWTGLTFVFNPDTDLNANSWYTANFTTAAKDDSEPGNTLASLYSWFFMTSFPDVTPPTISEVQAIPDPQEVHFSVNISAFLEDDTGIGVVSVNVTGPSGSSNDSMSLDASSGWFYLNKTYHQTGLHSFTIWAVDTSDNWNSSSGTFEIVDTTPPVIQHSPTGTIRVGQILNVTAIITDNYMLQEVRLNYTNVVGTNFNVTMLSAGGDEYYYEVPMQPNPGTLTYFIWAVDTSDNPAWTQMYTTTVLQNRPLPPQNLTVAPEGQGALRLNWEAPTKNEDGSTLTDLAGYILYRMTESGGVRERVNTAALIQGTTYLDTGLADDTTYYYVVTAVNSRSVESADSNEASGTTLKSTEPPSPWTELTWAIVAAVIIVIAVVASVLLFLMFKKRKKEEPETDLAPPKPSAETEIPQEEQKEP